MGEARSSDDERDPHKLARQLIQSYQAPQVFSRCHLLAVVFVGSLLSCLALSRLGTDISRGAAGLGIALSVLLLTYRVLRFAQWSKDLDLSLSRTLRHFESGLAGRIERAFRLFRSFEQAVEPGQVTSFDLARLHAIRAFEQLGPEQIKTVAEQARTRRSRWAVLLTCALVCGVLYWSMELVEGADVLLARGGRGAFPLAYVEKVEMTAEWPSYLDGTGERRRLPAELTGVPQGSEIEVRVYPLVSGRKLLLTDGIKEIPLISDGQGGLVARWIAEDPAGLKVAARFGDVLLFDVHQTRVQTMDDRTPVVLLAGTPRSVPLAEVDRLELEFVATDDHGLSQVDLVLSSGQRSSRSELAHLDGQTRVFRGGYALTREHELLRRPFLPVHVRVEARDGNSATGPAWGSSKELIILPEPLGKAAARRHIALRAFRSRVSAYHAQMHEAGYKDSQMRVSLESTASKELLSALQDLVLLLQTDSSAPTSSLAFLAAQVETLSRTGRERASSESVLLAVDALIQRLGQKEAAQLAKDLGQSVEELAVQARQLRFDPASLTMTGLLDLLAGNQAGADQLSEVGLLGLDLGAVAKADLARIERNINERSFDRAEAAALHLAERLKRATPSFSSSGGRAGVESGSPSKGSGSGTASGSGQSASDAPSEFEQLGRELNQLAQDGSQELGELDQLLKEAEEAVSRDFRSTKELDGALSELKNALSDLPEVGRGTGSAASEAAAARSQGEAMMEALAGGELAEAIEHGRDTERALNRAQSLREQGFGYVDGTSLQRAQQAVGRAIFEANKALDKQKTQSPTFDEQGKRERAARQRDLAARASQLAERGAQPQAALPREHLQHLGEASSLLKQAAAALDSDQVERSRKLAEQAQSHLDRASFEVSEQDANSAADGSEGKSSDMSLDAQVPDQEKDRARDFRERVERGLGRGSGRLGPAVRRYAEDLK